MPHPDSPGFVCAAEQALLYNFASYTSGSACAKKLPQTLAPKAFGMPVTCHKALPELRQGDS